MKNLLLFILLLPLSLAAQITGTVTDFRSNQPLIGANIVLQNDATRGTQSDLDGKFRLDCASGDSLIISYVGYKNKTVAAAADMSVGLREDGRSAGEVTVTAGKIIAAEFVTEQFSALDIYLNPNSKADALRAVDALPASTNTEESANVSLRGSAPGETGIFLNNIPLEDVVRFDQVNGIGQFSIFNTSLVESVNVFPSNPPAEFGNSTSGVVAVYTSDKLPQRKSSLGLNLTGISALHARPLSQKTGLTAYVNFNTHQLLTAANPKAFADMNAFGSTDAGLHLVHRFSEKTTLRVFNYSLSESYDFAVALPVGTEDFLQKKKRNLTTVNLVGKGRNTRWEWNQSFDFSDSEYSGGNLAVRQKYRGIFQALQGAYFKKNFSLKGGISARLSRSKDAGRYPIFTHAPGAEHPAAAFENRQFFILPESFAYGKYNLSAKQTLGGGLRFYPNGYGIAPYLDVQTNYNLQFSDNQRITLAAGRYRKLQTRQIFDGKPLLTESEQVSLDYQYQDETWKIQSALYLKNNRTGDLKNPIRGAEIFAAWQRKNFTGSVSAAHVSSLLQAEEFRYPSPYDLSYFLRLYAKYDLPDLWTLAVTYRQRQGRYFQPIIGAQFDENTDTFIPFYAAPDAGERLPAYRLADVSISKILPVSFGSIVLYATAGNVFDTKNVRAYDYNFDYTERSENLFGRRVFFVGGVLEW